MWRRYLIVLKYGGVYADLDTECRVPLDTYLASGSHLAAGSHFYAGSPALVVGLENEFESLSAALARSYMRQRQLIQWIFAAEEGHPALRELVARIAAAAASGAQHRPTQTRTIFTSAGISPRNLFGFVGITLNGSLLPTKGAPGIGGAHRCCRHRCAAQAFNVCQVTAGERTIWQVYHPVIGLDCWGHGY